MTTPSVPPDACRFLGAAVNQRVTVACVSIAGYARREELHACTCPALAGKVCLPLWPGPWKLPERAVDAAAIRLCHGCPRREPSD